MRSLKKALGLGVVVMLVVGSALSAYRYMQIGATDIRAVLGVLKLKHATVAREVLQCRYTAQVDYTQLVEAQAELNSQTQTLGRLCSKLAPAHSQTLLEELAHYPPVLQDLLDHVENFKTINSAYRNSLCYLPTAAERVVALLPAETFDFVAKIQEVLAQLLVHDLLNSSDITRIEAQLKELDDNAATQSPEAQDAIQQYIRHARNILTLRPGSEQVVNHILHSPSISHLGHVFTRFTELDAQIRRDQDLLLQALIVFSGALLGYLAMTFWQLRVTSAVLHEVNSTLEERIQVRTVELEQTSLQLAQAQKLESIGQLAAGVAHEINSPMQFVNDNMEYLSECTRDLFADLEAYRENLSTNGPQRSWQEREERINTLLQQSRYAHMREQVPQAIVESLEGIHRVIHIVRAMKEFSHPGTADKVSTDINQALRSTATISTNRWKYVADLEFDLADNLPDVQALPAELNQVFLNLVVNASDAIASKLGEDSGEKGRITIRTFAEKGFVVIAIQDTGCGIPEEIRHRVYDPFFTTKEVGKGTGQGLAISHDIIVNKHGGRLEMESMTGVGTTFFVRLPAVPPPQSQQTYVDNESAVELIEV